MKNAMQAEETCTYGDNEAAKPLHDILITTLKDRISRSETWDQILSTKIPR